MKLHHPSRAMTVACTALAVAVTGIGSAEAADSGLLPIIGTRQIKDGAVTHTKLADGAVGAVDLGSDLRAQLATHGVPGTAGPAGSDGTNGANGSNGANGTDGRDGTGGTNGTDGTDGTNGLNPATAVDDVPAIPAGSDIGSTGDAGFFFSGVNSAGTGDARSNADAFFANGQLVLQGTGVDSSLQQGVPGIAKSYSLPLASLTAIGYQWQNDTATSSSATTIGPGVTPAQGPSITVTVTGASMDGGTTNLVYTPALNNTNVTTTAQTCASTIPTITAGVYWEQDAFATGNCWYSTGDTSGNGSAGSPISIQSFMTRNPSAQITQITLDNGAGVSTTAGNYEAGADDLTIGFNGNNRRYDFGG